MINNNGYRIKPDDKTKKELTVSPYIPGMVNIKKYRLYRIIDEFMYIPKYYGLNKFGKPKEYSEQDGINITITFNGKLRDYQEDILAQILLEINDNDSCITSLYTGWGKTCAALYLISKLKVKTIIIVHKETLLKQWAKEIQKFCTNR